MSIHGISIVALYYGLCPLAIGKLHQINTVEMRIIINITMYHIVISLFFRAAKVDESHEEKDRKLEASTFYFCVKTNVNLLNTYTSAGAISCI